MYREKKEIDFLFQNILDFRESRVSREELKIADGQSGNLKMQRVVEAARGKNKRERERGRQRYRFT